MISAISRFRIANGTQAAVADAFAHRVGLVDKVVGFLGLEVYVDAADDALFYLVTRWTDRASFEAWHRSDAHHESHRGIPRGIKLDKALTRLSVMKRIPSGNAADGLDAAAADAAPFLAQFLRHATAMLVLASGDGAVRCWNPAAARCFGADPTGFACRPFWDLLDDDSAARLRGRVANGRRTPSERFELRPRAGAPSLDCRVDLRPDGFILLAEPRVRGDESLLDEITKINNEVVELSRESARKEQALVRALADLEEKNAALEQANRRIAELARTDPMTGTFNRRHFDAALGTETSRLQRDPSALSAVMMDLDHFKSVNDRYGHGTGDAVLIAAAAALKSCSRPYDVVARYGGEEFVLLLPDTALDAAIGCAERLRAAIEALRVEGYPHRITASFGVATLGEGEDGSSLLGRADRALYRAKNGGRNRVEGDLSTSAPAQRLASSARTQAGPGSGRARDDGPAGPGGSDAFILRKG